MENAAAQPQQPAAAEPALPLRRDTFLGVCEALGEDFGIPANLFRIAFAGLFFWNMVLAVGAYFGIGAVVAVSRWLYPARCAAAPAEQTEAAPADEAESETEMSLAA